MIGNPFDLGVGGPGPVNPFALEEDEEEERKKRLAATMFAGASETGEIPGAPLPQYNPLVGGTTPTLSGIGRQFMHGLEERKEIGLGGAKGAAGLVARGSIPEKLQRAHELAQPHHEALEANDRQYGQPMNALEDIAYGFGPEMLTGGLLRAGEMVERGVIGRRLAREALEQLPRIDAAEQIARELNEKSALEAAARQQQRMAGYAEVDQQLNARPSETSQLLRQHDAQVLDAQAAAPARAAEAEQARMFPEVERLVKRQGPPPPARPQPRHVNPFEVADEAPAANVEPMRDWDGWNWRTETGEEPGPEDVAPERTPAGDFVLYHGTSNQAAEQIVREGRLRADGLGSVGVGTQPSDVSVYAAMKSREGGGSAILRVELDKNWVAQNQVTHEVGGSGHGQFLFRSRGGIPPEAIKSIRVVRRNGEDIPFTADAASARAPDVPSSEPAAPELPPGGEFDQATGKWTTPQEEVAARRADPIVAAAVRAENGEIFTGPNHGLALVSMEEAGHRATSLHADTSKDLFVTKSGKYITRAELKEEWGGRRPVAELMKLPGKDKLAQGAVVAGLGAGAAGMALEGEGQDWSAMLPAAAAIGLVARPAGAKGVARAFARGAREFASASGPMRTRQWAAITAANPGGKALSEAENLARNQEMESLLRRMGYNPIPSKGAYIDPDTGEKLTEPGFLVPEMSPDVALQVTRRFGQNSALTSKGYLRADGTINPARQLRFGDKRATAWTEVMDENPLTGSQKPVRFTLETAEEAVPHKPPPHGSVPSVDVARRILMESAEPGAKVRLSTREIESELKRPGNALDWYRQSVRKMEDATRQLFPDTQSPTRMTLFKAVLAITSNGQKVDPNYQAAADLWQAYLEGRGLSLAKNPSIKRSPRWKTHEQQLRRLEVMIAQDGEEGAAKWLLGKSMVGKRKPTEQFNSLQFGPKIGRFFLNLHGINAEVTVDMWALRTWRRWKGIVRTRIDQGSEILDDAPTAAEKREIRAAMTTLAQRVAQRTGKKIDPADVQALLWYYEKNLFKKYGARDSGNRSFADAAESFLEQRGGGRPSPAGGAGLAAEAAGAGATGRPGVSRSVRGAGGSVSGGGTLYSGIDPKHIGRAAASAGLAGAGYGLTESDNPELQATGRGVMALAALHAVGARRFARGARSLARPAFDGLKGSPLGRRLIEAANPEALLTPEAREAIYRYERDVAKASARAKELAGKSRALGPAGDRKVSDVIEGEAFEGAQLTPQETERVLAVAAEISAEFTRVGRAKVGAGLLSAEAVAKREGKYLPRKYGMFEAEDALAGRPSGTRAKTSKAVRIGQEHMRKDLEPDVRNLMGEVREASYRTEEGLVKSGKDLAAHRLFQALRAMPDAMHPEFRAALEAGDEEALKQIRRMGAAHRGGEWVTLPDTRGLGPLRGAVVRREIANSINGLPEIGGAGGAILRYWKKVHTVYNPGTHFGNFASNVSLAHLAGLNVWEQPVALARAVRDLKHYGPGTKALAEAGVLDTNLATVTGEGAALVGRADKTKLRELAATTRPETRRALEREGLKTMGPGERKLRRADQKISRLYNNEDNVFRVALFNKLTKRAEQGGMGMDPKQAAEVVREQLINFRTRSPLLNLTRNTVSPFLLFPAKALPLVARQIVEHPVRWMTLAAVWGGVDQYSQKQVGRIPDQDLADRDQRNKAVGYVLPGFTQLPAQGERGERFGLDISRWTPLSSVTTGGAPGSTGSAISEDIPAILQPSGPLIDALARTALNVDPFTGDPFIRPSDDTKDILQKATVGRIGAGKFEPGAAAGFLLPSALSYQLPRLASDLANDDTKAAKTDALGLVGARPRVIQPGQEMDRRRYEHEKELMDIRAEMRRDLRRAKSRDAKIAVFERARKKRRAAITNFREERSELVGR